MPDTPEFQFTVSTQTSVHGRTPESESALVVKWQDLQRIENEITALAKIRDENTELIGILEGAFVGGCIAGFIEALGAYKSMDGLIGEQASTAAAWVLLYAMIGFCAGILALGLELFRRTLRTKVSQSVQASVQRIQRELHIIKAAVGGRRGQEGELSREDTAAE